MDFRAYWKNLTSYFTSHDLSFAIGGRRYFENDTRRRRPLDCGIQRVIGRPSTRDSATREEA